VSEKDPYNHPNLLKNDLNEQNIKYLIMLLVVIFENGSSMTHYTSWEYGLNKWVVMIDILFSFCNF